MDFLTSPNEREGIAAAQAEADFWKAKYEGLIHKLEHERFKGLMLGQDPAKVWHDKAVELAHRIDEFETEQIGLHTDNKRLNWLMQNSARVVWDKTGETCRVWYSNTWDGVPPRPITGKHFNNPRLAIDDAMEATKEDQT